MTGPLCRRALLAGAATAMVMPAGAQPMFSRPIRLLVGFAPGGSADAVARLVAPELGRLLGQSVVVENRAGASGSLATAALLQAPPDGHTLGFAGLQIATNPAMLNTPYDPRELTMVSQMTALPVLVMASAKSGLTTLPEAIAAARAKPGALNCGSGGYGTTSHLGPELLFRSVGTSCTIVVYRGGGPALQGLIAGDVELMFDIASAGHRPAIEAGTMRALAVLQAQRAAELPDVAAIAEFGFGPEVMMRSWQGIMVRSGTPRPIVEALHRAVVAAVQNPEVEERLRRMGMEPAVSPTPEAFQQLYESELARWTTVIRASGVKPQ